MNDQLPEIKGELVVTPLTSFSLIATLQERQRSGRKGTRKLENWEEILGTAQNLNDHQFLKSISLVLSHKNIAKLFLKEKCSNICGLFSPFVKIKKFDWIIKGKDVGSARDNPDHFQFSLLTSWAVHSLCLHRD